MTWRGKALAAALLLPSIVAASPACGSNVGAAESGPGVADQGIGAACVPQQENDPAFLAYDEHELNFELKSPTCKTGLCVVNHFRGRVSCPYGQDASGKAPAGASACETTGGAAVTGGVPPVDPRRQARVAPQCLDRTAAKTVYCSCRCSNDKGRTDDGGVYCACPTDFECTPLLTFGGPDVAGSYCIKRGTLYDATTACRSGDCDPVTAQCL